METQQVKTSEKRAIKWGGRAFTVVIIIGLICLALSGVFRVESDEVALILRFGKLVGDNPSQALLGPGLHFAFPYVIDEVIKVPTGKIQEITISTHYDAGATLSASINENGYAITGDSNILLIQAVAKYRIDDAIAYALNRASVETEIDRIISGVMFSLVSQAKVDDLLTSQKASLAEDIRHNSQGLLDELDCGVTLTGIELVNITPPKEVQSDFDAVTSAAVEKETEIQRANQYREIAVPDAQATAQRQITTAQTEQTQAVTAAENFVSTLEGLLAQYEASPESVMEGQLRARISAVLSKMTVLIAQAGENAPGIVLP